MPQVDDADDARVSLARRRPPLSAGIASDGSPGFPASRQPRVGTPLLREIAARPFRAAARAIHARERHARRAEPAWRTRTPADGASRTTSRVGAGRLSAPRRLRRGSEAARGTEDRAAAVGVEGRAPSSTRATHQLVPHAAPLTLAAPRRAVENPSDGPGPGRPGRRPAAGARPREGKGGEGAPEEGLRGVGPRPIPFFERARANYPPAKELPRARARLRDRRRPS